MDPQHAETQRTGATVSGEKKQFTKENVCYNKVIQGKIPQKNFYMCKGDALQISKSSYTGEGSNGVWGVGCEVWEEATRALAVSTFLY